jgi:hypothetical protein
MNSNLLKEAIADARAVKATALANAKAALDEAFNQRFSAVFADKLREDSSTEQPVPGVAETVEPKDATPSKSDGTTGWKKNGDAAAKPTAKNITPNTIPAAKDGGDGTKGWSKDNKGNAFDGTPNGIKETADADADDRGESVEETVTNEDLDEIIRELEAEAGGDSSPDALGGDLDGAGDPGAGDDLGADLPPAVDAGGEPLKSGDTITITKVPAAGAAPTDVPPADPGADAGLPDAGADAGADAAPVAEEDIDLNELMASLNEEAAADDLDEGSKEEKCEDDDDKKEVDESLTNQLNEITAQRDEAYKTVKYLKGQLNEFNLLNAKLLYTNKLFKEFGMDRGQKMKVVEAFDLTKNVREVKMTYANWCESLNFGGKAKKRVTSVTPNSSVTTITEGSASKIVASTKPTAVITEGVNDMAIRFKKLAGIKSK